MCDSSVRGQVRPCLPVFLRTRIARRLENRELSRSCCNAIESLLACYAMNQMKIESAHFLMFVCRCWMKLAPGCLSAPFNISCFISCMLASVTYENNTKLCSKKNMKILTDCKNNPTFPSLCDWCYTDDKRIEQFSIECQKVIQDCIGFPVLYYEQNQNPTVLSLLSFQYLRHLRTTFIYSNQSEL